MLRLILPCLFCLTYAAGAEAQIVYRCTTSSGAEVFADSPCGNDAVAVDLREHRPLSGDEGDSVRLEVDPATQLDLHRRGCLRDAEAEIGAEATQRIAELRREVRLIDADAADAAERVAALESAIAVASAEVDGARLAASLRCGGE